MRDRVRFIPVHDLAQRLGERMCNALITYHALTGCDFNSSLAGIGKKTAWDALKRSETHQQTLCLLGQQQELDQATAAKFEAYVCNLYPSSRREVRATDELRYILFCQKKQRKLSPYFRLFKAAHQKS